ncbi:phage baseplate assembly protein V [Leptolyngbya ohadii]|uniref:phage baseplate assembly protein V n=1 Tax=Leptolyngbya ohadii TaxID=1962290 RepID=UPI000B59EC58|nr:phage baseplate assembly protein V [Leptolyngbya ohadii]
MQTMNLFETPLSLLHASYLAEVVSVQDPDRLSRVQVRLLSFDGIGNQDASLWARVAVPFAGGRRGAFLLPDVGDEVLVMFANGDSRYPVVVGGLWNGRAPAPETLGGGGDRVDRWTLVGKAGTRIAIVEQGSGGTISFTTPGGVSGVLTDDGSGKIEFKAAGTTITVDTSGVSVQVPAKVSVQASQVEVNAGQVTVNAAMSSFSGVVRCDVLQATTVVATTYTPGAGNVW